MIDAEHLCKSYGDREVLHDVGFHADRGELVACLGPNGAGKTTTIRILTGRTAPDSGRVLLSGIDIARDPVAAKALCGVAGQYLNLDPDLTIRENLDIHGRFFRMPKKARTEAEDRLLALTRMTDRADTPVKQLSGGQKRRVVLARALMHSPKILFLDEPTAGLDPVGRSEILGNIQSYRKAIRRTLWGIISSIRGAGTTILMTTHYIEEAELLADRVILLDQGHILPRGTPKELIRRTGAWAVDTHGRDGFTTECFPTREEAAAFMEADKERALSSAVRPATLEDSYLRLTGHGIRE